MKKYSEVKMETETSDTTDYIKSMLQQICRRKFETASQLKTEIVRQMLYC